MKVIFNKDIRVNENRTFANIYSDIIYDISVNTPEERIMNDWHLLISTSSIDIPRIDRKQSISSEDFKKWLRNGTMRIIC